MHVFHMKSVSNPQEDAYVVASNKTSALGLYIKKFGHDPDYSMCMDCGESILLMEESNEHTN